MQPGKKAEFLSYSIAMEYTRVSAPVVNPIVLSHINQQRGPTVELRECMFKEQGP